MKRLLTLLLLFSALLSFGQRATKRVHELELETTLNNSYSLLVDSPEFLGLKRLDLLGLKTFFYSSLEVFESDPIFISWDKSTGISITENQISNLGNYLTDIPSIYVRRDLNENISADWAFAKAIREEGSLLTQKYAAKSHNHDSTYLSSFTETDPTFTAWNKSTGISITKSQVSDFGTYLTSFTESDPSFTNWLGIQDINGDQMIDEAGQALNAAALGGQPGSYFLNYNNFTNVPTVTESDPVYSAWNKSTGISITKSQVSDFGTYLTSFTESDPSFTNWLVLHDVNSDQMIDEAAQALNATALGGQPGSYFLNYNNFTNVPTFLTSLSGDGSAITNVNATTVNGYNTNYTGTTAYTIPVHNGDGDLFARLFRSTYGEQTSSPASTADIAFRNSTTDNYIRFMSQSAMKTWMGIGQALLTNSNVNFGTVSGSNFYGTNFYLSSDRRLKENIKPLSENLAYNLNPISHTWINKDSTITEVGFIADEVKKINGALVTTKPDGFDAVNYAKITAINNAAIQDLNIRLKAIEGKLTKLLEKKL